MFLKSLGACATVLSLAPVAFAAASPKVSAPEERVRKAIDNICGDTWCEGDFRFAFTRVVLDAKVNQFSVEFIMTPYLEDETVLDDESVTAILSPAASVTCVVKGYSDADLIVDKTGSLNWTVYEALSKCVNGLEDKLVK